MTIRDAANQDRRMAMQCDVQALILRSLSRALIRGSFVANDGNSESG